MKVIIKKKIIIFLLFCFVFLKCELKPKIFYILSENENKGIIKQNKHFCKK